MTKYKLEDGIKVEMNSTEIKEAEDIAKSYEDNKASIRLKNLRAIRNILLSETDWRSGSDLTMSDAWKKYRQDLRDITKTFQSMSDKDFKFPTKPS